MNDTPKERSVPPEASDPRGGGDATKDNHKLQDQINRQVRERAVALAISMPPPGRGCSQILTDAQKIADFILNGSTIPPRE